MVETLVRCHFQVRVYELLPDDQHPFCREWISNNQSQKEPYYNDCQPVPEFEKVGHKGSSATPGTLEVYNIPDAFPEGGILLAVCCGSSFFLFLYLLRACLNIPLSSA